jgi:parallel beta-helix repeat protein
MTPAPFRRVLAAVGLLLGAAAADAATIHVTPGPGTPLQDAIDAAAPGDTLRLAAGGYFESVVITEALTLAGPPGTYLDAHPPAAVIAAGCGTGATAVTVAADGVKIRDLRVITYGQYGVDVTGRDGFKLQNVLILPNCPPPFPVYSLNVTDSRRVKIDNSWIAAVVGDIAEAAIHLGGITARNGVRMTRTLAGDHDVGLLIEDCTAGSVRISKSFANHNNVTGIQLQNTDGIELKKNQVAKNTTNGIAVDAASDDNRIVGNDVSGSTTDVSDAGTGNCWKNNTYGTGSVAGCP